MKLAFSTLGCPDWTLSQAIQQASELGFQGIEIRGIGSSLRADTIDELCGEKRQFTLQSAKTKGITFCCLDASASFHETDKRQENMEEAQATLKQAADCNIPYIRVFGNYLTSSDKNAQIADIAAQLRILCNEASFLNVDVLLEVHGDFNCSERILKTADAVGCDNFGIIWDIKHSDGIEAPEHFWKNTKHLIHHVHIKDSIRDRLCSIGEGTLPVASIVRMLADDNYSGYYCLEWEKRWHPELRDAQEEFPSYVEKMREILKKG